jgi:UDP-N-acetylglucosamine 2-epimerase (non-hydrolysing)
MPEEINRILTDAISDFLFTTEESANENLQREGITAEKIFFVGNVMIDTLMKHKEAAEKSDILFRVGLIEGQTGNVIKSVSSVNGSYDENSIVPYAVLTLHRPSNVDDRKTFTEVLGALSVVGKEIPIIFPVHPRTVSRIREFKIDWNFNWLLYDLEDLNCQTVVPHGIEAGNAGIYCLNPLGYLDFLKLMSHAKLVLTDSGGIQEETTILGIPCVTLRQNTERPVTVMQGTNVIAGNGKENIVECCFSQLNKLDRLKKRIVPEFWEGKAAERIVEIIAKRIGILYSTA